MRHFLRTAFIFSLPIVAALAFTERRLTNVPNAYTAKLRLLDEQRASVAVLVLGSSHEYQGVNTDALGLPAFNLAMPSESLTQSAEIGLKYLPTFKRTNGSQGARLTLPRLRNVLLGVAYHSLPYLMADANDDRLGFYLRSYHVFGDAHVGDVVNPLRYLYLGIYGWGGTQAALRNPTSVGLMDPVGETGYAPADRPPLEGRVTAEVLAGYAADRVRYHRSLARESSIAVNLDAIRRLARGCQVAHVHLVLITTPVTQAYADAFGDEGWHRYRSLIESLAREFDLDYTDYSRSPAFTLKDFADTDHLTGDGATRFARMLSASLTAR